MQVSNKALAASTIGAGLAVAATQQADISLTAPIAVSADLMRVMLPAIMAIVPLLLTQFAPGLLPLWEWVKKLLPLPAELAEYQKALDIKAADPSCPMLHRKARSMIERAFESRHPEPVQIAPGVVARVETGVPDAK